VISDNRYDSLELVFNEYWSEEEIQLRKLDNGYFALIRKANQGESNHYCSIYKKNERKLLNNFQSSEKSALKYTKIISFVFISG
jgi:hypothetical protein